MLRNVRHLRGYAILATDGAIGEVEDLYFDDDRWAIRYLVVDTGSWLPGRKVLISPHAIGRPDWMAQQLPVTLTKAQVEGSPDVDTRKPVSRQLRNRVPPVLRLPALLGRGRSLGLGGVSGQPHDRRQLRSGHEGRPDGTDAHARRLAPAQLPGRRRVSHPRAGR